MPRSARSLRRGDYRRALTAIVRLADRGTFSLAEAWGKGNDDAWRWQAACQWRGALTHYYGPTPYDVCWKLLDALRAAEAKR